MIKILLGAVFSAFLLTCSIKVVAADVDFSWVIPTERVDGTALDISEISHYNLYYTKAGSPTQVIQVGPTLTQYTQLVEEAGTYTAQISTVEVVGARESELSDPTSFTITEKQAASIGKMTINFSWSCPEPCNLEVTQ